MSTRSLDILDLPFLARSSQDVLALDSARLLTRGNPIGARALLSYLNPGRQLYTAIATENGDSLMGQVTLKMDEPSARLTFLAPAEKVNGLTLPLLDHLSRQAGEWGALHILAEVDEDSPAFKLLRQAGFAMYAWQRAWRLPKAPGRVATHPWSKTEEIDWPGIQSLRGQIVPALLQPIENLPKEALGLACYAQGDLQAFVAVDSGTRGIWLQPLMPPEMDCAAERLMDMLSAIPGAHRLPVYLCVRSYQAWLESVLDELGAEPGPRQAIMVKRLAMAIKEAQTIPGIEKALAKVNPAAPVTHAVKSPSADASPDG